MLHEIRSDYAQILTTTFLLVNGPGKWSLDSVLQRKFTKTKAVETIPLDEKLDLAAYD